MAQSKQVRLSTLLPNAVTKPNFQLGGWTAHDFNGSFTIEKNNFSEFTYVIDKGPSPKIFSRVNLEYNLLKNITEFLFDGQENHGHTWGRS